MTATATEQAIAGIIMGHVNGALGEEEDTQAQLAAACTEGGKYPLATYMDAALRAEADAAPWHTVSNNINTYRVLDGADEPTVLHLIKAARAAYEQHLNTLIKNSPSYTSNPMSNLVADYQREGIRKFVATLGPLLGRLK